MVTEGSVEAVIVSGVAVTVMLIEADANCAGLPLSLTEAVNVATPVRAEDFFRVGLLESLTVTSKEKFPPTLGVPVMMPVDAASDSPEGRLPEVMLHL